ncbi:hypothetical protein [Methanothermobacter sp.]|uniref:hypothetical protein n=1 Tax=Methanothermobacter sp. TaxID=1884223 RepID=UPI00260CA08A|nr:hypothetical protein [Methanothermobacter sp.]MDI9618434.1 hypothetical protein [Methanothermobacter sp.]
MNARILLVISLIFIFAFLSGGIGYITLGGPDLASAVRDGSAEVIQKGGAGDVPNTVEIRNTGNKPVRVDSGTLLASNTSGDLVIATDTHVSPGSAEDVPAYSVEPEERTVPGVKLEPAGKAPALMVDVLSSNPADPSEAFNTQLKVWVLARGDELNIYRGEVYAMVKKRDMRFYQLRENITAVRSELMDEYGLTEEQLSELNITSPILNQTESPFKLFSVLDALKNQIGARQ